MLTDELVIFWMNCHLSNCIKYVVDPLFKVLVYGNFYYCALMNSLDIWVIDQARSQYGYILSSFFVRVYEPRRKPVSTSLVIKGFVTWQYNKYIAGNNGQSRSRAVKIISVLPAWVPYHSVQFGSVLCGSL